MATGSGSTSSRGTRPARARKATAAKSVAPRKGAVEAAAAAPSASKQRPEPAQSTAGSPVGAGLPSMQDWMQMWQGMADDLSKMGGVSQLPAVSVDTNSMLDLQKGLNHLRIKLLPFARADYTLNDIAHSSKAITTILPTKGDNILARNNFIISHERRQSHAASSRGTPTA